MPTLSPQRLQEYRSTTFRISPSRRVKSKEEAIAFVQERGFIYFWPIRGIPLPNLWAAVVGDRPVADAHDDPGHVTWGWKDSLLGQRAWYYAKVLRKRATMIAFSALPFFYALSENYGSPEEDYLTLYEQGRLTQEARLLYEALLEHGPLDTIALRKASHLTNQESNARFEKALSDLQADFKIVPVGVAEVGAWRYAFIYNIVPHQYPDLLDLAHPIRESAAHLELTRLYFLSLGASRPRDLLKLFGWRAPAVEKAIDTLVQSGFLCRGLTIESQPGEWVALQELTA
ncbi:MAG: hypothetical protein JW726_17150 [Anaerolineales bacterium]|nr:hypothetical protein [Anaerolineales bacterium]